MSAGCRLGVISMSFCFWLAAPGARSGEGPIPAIEERILEELRALRGEVRELKEQLTFDREKKRFVAKTIF